MYRVWGYSKTFLNQIITIWVYFTSVVGKNVLVRMFIYGKNLYGLILYLFNEDIAK